MTTTMKYASLELGTVEAVFNKLGGLEGAQSFLRGDTEVIIKTHTINCDADPMIPKDWKVEEHVKGGKIEFDPAKIALHLVEEQKKGVINGNELRKKLKGKSVLNANVLDYLLANPQIIPEEWKGKLVFFWGTIYCHPGGNLFVPFLNWNSGRWYGDCFSLDIGFNVYNPAVVSASN